jgi:hypothetical protein
MVSFRVLGFRLVSDFFYCVERLTSTFGVNFLVLVVTGNQFTFVHSVFLACFDPANDFVLPQPYLDNVIITLTCVMRCTPFAALNLNFILADRSIVNLIIVFRND